MFAVNMFATILFFLSIVRTVTIFIRFEGIGLDACFGSEEVDQRDFLFQQVGRLERIARKAENAGQFSAAVGAITALNRMMALGADQKGFRGHPTHYYRR